MTISELDKYEKAGEIHKNIRKLLNDSNLLKPGVKLVDLCNIIETNIKTMKAKVAFPTGTSINNTIAHYTPQFMSNETLNVDDVLKLDFGVHIDGCIIDSAFTYCNNPIFEPLINATKTATYEAIKESSVDARLGYIGNIIEEIITSYELDINGKILPIIPIYNLGGHSIEKYILHGKKIVPLFNEPDNNEKMAENDIFAIETFATTGSGSGYATEDKTNTSYFAKTNHQKHSKQKIVFNKSKKLLYDINKTYQPLPFSTRQLNVFNNDFGIKELLNKKIIEPYPPLLDIPNSYSSQLEHTIIIGENKKYYLSMGNDY
jgi:methionyl aminopeptidase